MGVLVAAPFVGNGGRLTEAEVARVPRDRAQRASRPLSRPPEEDGKPQRCRDCALEYPEERGRFLGMWRLFHAKGRTQCSKAACLVRTFPPCLFQGLLIGEIWDSLGLAGARHCQVKSVVCSLLSLACSVTGSKDGTQ